MDTPLDLYALTQIPELSAAQRLTSASTPELLALATLCHLRPKSRIDKTDLIAMILTVTHPRPAPPPPISNYQQERLI